MSGWGVRGVWSLRFAISKFPLIEFISILVPIQKRHHFWSLFPSCYNFARTETEKVIFLSTARHDQKQLTKKYTKTWTLFMEIFKSEIIILIIHVLCAISHINHNRYIYIFSLCINNKFCNSFFLLLLFRAVVGLFKYGKTYKFSKGIGY